ncbi:beta-lactamase hydrolase domain-containing protein [Pelomonas sp. BJYL3]|uniref:beta-lactamase hydrolase domain-containing protein n=1 Tax=Pelomonas sp. BJYL3 TaxID=2976697 RepID=UPI0022B37B02|nr:sulfur transferase domain-containing protein [Pelomonas sp. BJYL3]
MTTLPRSARPWLSPGKAFLFSLLFTAIGVLAYAGWLQYLDAQTLRRIAPRQLAASVDVTTQLHPADLAALRWRYAVIVDLRPDGEVAGQPSSQEMEAEASQQGLRFRYIPVPHGEIPEAAADRLREVLAEAHGSVLLYCRSGKRAARTWALAEAARADGLSSSAIVTAVQKAGQEADDLQGRIERAVKARRKETP